MDTELKVGDAVRVRGFSGVACRFLGFAKEWEPAQFYATDPDTGDEYLVDDDYEGDWVDDPSRAVIRMVGDDHKHTVSIEDLHPVDETEFCGCCGQIGCAWGAATEEVA